MVSYVSVVAGHMPPKFQSMLLADGQFYPAIIGQFYAAIDTGFRLTEARGLKHTPSL